MFDAVEGVLRDNAGRPWFPFNPRYDPGPLPGAKADAVTDHSGNGLGRAK